MLATSISATTMLCGLDMMDGPGGTIFKPFWIQFGGKKYDDIWIGRMSRNWTAPVQFVSLKVTYEGGMAFMRDYVQYKPSKVVIGQEGQGFTLEGKINSIECDIETNIATLYPLFSDWPSTIGVQLKLSTTGNADVIWNVEYKKTSDPFMRMGAFLKPTVNSLLGLEKVWQAVDTGENVVNLKVKTLDRVNDCEITSRLAAISPDNVW